MNVIIFFKNWIYARIYFLNILYLKFYIEFYNKLIQQTCWNIIFNLFSTRYKVCKWNSVIELFKINEEKLKNNIKIYQQDHFILCI